jgi:hypothetical protein
VRQALALGSALAAFIAEHEYCGELDSAVEDDRVWMTCTCGAVRPDAGASGLSPSARLPPAILTEVPMRLIGLAVVLTVSLVLAALAAQGQPATKVPTVGFILAGPLAPC